MYRIAIDTGGTFTDCVVLDDHGAATAVKSPTTPEDPVRGVITALHQAGLALGIEVGALLENTESFVHACTIARDTIIQRSGCKTGLITTKGHEDTLLIGRVFQKVAGLTERQISHISQLHKAEPPLIPPKLIRGVSERVDYRGDVIVRLNMHEVVSAVGYLAREGVESIAICLLWSFLNPGHERAIKDYVQRTYPRMFVTTSHELVPLLGEYERSVTTAINSYVGPKVGAYLDHLTESLRQLGYARPLLIMHSGGGLTTTDEAREKAVLTLDSGPAAGAIGSRFVGNTCDKQNVICADMGGTSFNVSFIQDGDLQLEKTSIIDQYVIQLPKVLVKSVGASGSSVAWLDDMGGLHVGPRGVGNVPGPACYGRGGTEPTVTDASVLLGYLSSDTLLGGQMPLDHDAASKAIGRLADEMHMDVMPVASGIFAIYNAQMADLVRKCAIERGYDPQDFVLLAYGGAGAMHAAFCAEDVGVRSVYVPRQAAVLSACGMLAADVTRTAQTSRTFHTPLDHVALNTLNALFDGLTESVLSGFRQQGTRAENVHLRRSISMRYQMQVHELSIDTPLEPLNHATWSAIQARFERRYAAAYGQGTYLPEASIELVAYRVDGSLPLSGPEIHPETERAHCDPSDARKGTRSTYRHDAGEFVPTPVYDGGRLRWGHFLAGPAVVERTSDCVVIPAQFSGVVDRYGSIVLRKNDAHQN